MKTLLIIVFAIVFCSFHAAAQNPNPITIKKGGFFKGKVYERCEIELTTTQLITLFRKDPKMEKYVKPMAIDATIDLLCSSVGSAMILWPIGQAIGGKKHPDWILAGIGAGLYAVSIPFKIAYEDKATKAVNYYNSGYQSTSSVDLKLGVGGNGVGLVMGF